MQRTHAGYVYPQMAATTHHRYSGTSSAFSASANPNEDWTKISDLAERRRIQNRIAQRNYRKKLKKRLEDLEKRAASNSASPEQKPLELERSDSQHSHDSHSAEAADHYQQGRRTPEYAQNPYMQAHDDRGMFSHQYTRQLSTSPPPFSYSTYQTPEQTAWAPYQQPLAYHIGSSAAPEVQAYPPYLPPLSSAYPTTLPSVVEVGKPHFYGEDEISPFSMSYASMAGIEIPVSQPYHESDPHTPPLSECFDCSTAGSPPDSAHNYPATPASMPTTPPLHLL